MSVTLSASTTQQLPAANDLIHDAKALQAHAAEHGCLYFKNLLNRASVLDTRKQICEVIAKLGWIKPEQLDGNAIAARSGIGENDGGDAFFNVYKDIQSLHAFHQLAHDPALIAALDQLFGEKTLVHPRHIARVMFPDANTTPPHQDYLHIRGTENTWTAWIPLGDLPHAMGGLAVLPGSHQRGLLPTVAMPGAGGSGIESDQWNQTPWQTTEYQIGDVLLIHSLCIHASLPNTTGTNMRLSADYRYQPASEPVTKTSLLPHHNKWPWDELYANWPKDSPIKYYWHDMKLNTVEAHSDSNY